VTASDFDTAQSNYEVAKAQVDAGESGVEVARAALHQAELNLGYATIVSPIDGTVISRNIDVGQTVQSAFQAPTLFLIAKDLRKMQVDTSVSEADVGRLEPGKSVTFTVDAYPGEPFAGRVRQIRSSPTTVQNVVTYDAVIDVENPNLLLRPSMTANTSFVAAQKDDVVRLRNAALRFEPDAQLLTRIGVKPPAQSNSPRDPNGKELWVLRDGKPVPIAVSVGVTDGTWSELVQGDVRPGDLLITDMTMDPKRGLL
jgi:HlyD family secretion protein